jgi:large subunit ribosomal protein L16
MLSPKRTKYRKRQRSSADLRGEATRGNKISFGDYGLVALDSKWITNRQIEAARIAMTRKIRRGGKVWIRIFPDMPYTKKPAETRMGKGKGIPEYWVAAVKRGTVMFEMSGISTELAKDALQLAGNKLPIRTKFVKRRGVDAR